MATKFYFPSSGTPPAEPSYDTSWDSTTEASRLPCYTTKQSTAISYANLSTDTDKTDKDLLARQYVSRKIGAATISAQTIKMQILAAETDADNNLFLAVSVRSWNGSSFQTILALTRDDLEVYAAASQNRQFTATSSTVTVSDGDRIVIEFGLGGDPATKGTGHQGNLRIGDDSSSDLPEDNTSTSLYCPWLQFTTSTLAWYENSSKHAYLTGAVGSSDNTPAFTSGTASTSDSSPAYTNGKLPGPDVAVTWVEFLVPTVSAPEASDSNPVYIAGQSSISSSKSAYLVTTGDVTESKHAYLRGEAVDSSQTAAYLGGGTSTDSSKHGYLEGSSEDFSYKPAFAKGQLSDLDSTPAYTTGVIRDSISAYTNGFREGRRFGPAIQSG